MCVRSIIIYSFLVSTEDYIHIVRYITIISEVSSKCARPTHSMDSPAAMVSVGVEACQAVSLAGMKDSASGWINTSYTSFVPFALRSVRLETKRMVDNVQGIVRLKISWMEKRIWI